MFEDDIYRTSSQYRLWSFTEASLRSLRENTNAVASQRVRAALRRAREARQSANSSAAGTPTAGTTGDGKGAEEKDIDCLTPEEEKELVRFYCEKAVELADTYKPPLPTTVRATAIQYIRRFYLSNSPMTYSPKTIMPCALFLATKTDNFYMSLRQFAEKVPGDSTAEDIIAPEFLIMQSLRFTFDVRHPFRGLEGGVMELQAMAEGLGQPAPHLPQQTSEDLRRGLLAVPAAPNAPQSSSITDRIGRAHTTTRELLKTAAQMTDAYFLYTPSQIWLAAFMLADRPMAEYYLDTKLGGPAAQSSNAQARNPLYDLRVKLFRTLNECAALLQSYKPLSSDPEQMKNLKRIGKKFYYCQNPEKISLAGQKRIPAAAAAAAASAGEGATSESEVERQAKKRKLEREQKDREARDIFGGELVAQRVKEGQVGEQQHPS
ncbi:ubiquitin-conjugating enzyme E2 1 [Aspergillus udagawae]|uniref:RNA polymerase II holoenzyme cyclin-like subunit n=1 Tax=Aspergillus udagawae TaxID=91492 RepID=A0A8H3N198_9EURO|nr:ubiquitin-conjugating enzyme E2 1 [Aspergillus udagawae]